MPQKEFLISQRVKTGAGALVVVGGDVAFHNWLEAERCWLLPVLFHKEQRLAHRDSNWDVVVGWVWLGFVRKTMQFL
jgi:hypothetical protein